MARLLVVAHNDVVPGADEQSLRGLAWVRDDFDRVIACASSADLDRASLGTRWTNRELLFHMWFGQRITRAVVVLMAVTSRFPRGLDVAFARLLSLATAPYNWVNYAGAVVGVRIVGLRLAQRWMRADTEWLLAWSSRAEEDDLTRGMRVPTSWDPYFAAWMNRADVLSWAPKHYSHHRAQLTLTDLPAADM